MVQNSFIELAQKTFLPNQDEQLFLRCILGCSPQEAWVEFEKNASDLCAQLGSEGSPYRRLQPLFCRSLEQYEIQPPKEVLTQLRIALLHEEARSQDYWRAVDQVLEDIRVVDPHPVILRGQAIAKWCYPEPFLRHSHDIDIAVLKEHLSEVKNRLRKNHYQETMTNSSKWGLRSVFIHPSTLEVVLHEHNNEYRLFPKGKYLLPNKEDLFISRINEIVSFHQHKKLFWYVDLIYLYQSGLDMDYIFSQFKVKRLSVVASMVFKLFQLLNIHPQDSLEQSIKRLLSQADDYEFAEITERIRLSMPFPQRYFPIGEGFGSYLIWVITKFRKKFYVWA